MKKIYLFSIHRRSAHINSITQEHYYNLYFVVELSQPEEDAVIFLRDLMEKFPNPVYDVKVHEKTTKTTNITEDLMDKAIMEEY